MTSDADGFLDEPPPRSLAVGRIRHVPLGAKVVLAGAALLFFSLFLTWQNLEVVYQGAGTGTLMLDGWDFWGLLVGFLLLGLVGMVLIAKTSDPNAWPDAPWELLILVVSCVIFALVLVKNLTDRNSATVSYVALLIAGTIVVGAFFDWTTERLRGFSVPRRRRRRLSSGA
jgi:hypothetical protein